MHLFLLIRKRERERERRNSRKTKLYWDSLKGCYQTVGCTKKTIVHIHVYIMLTETEEKYIVR